MANLRTQQQEEEEAFGNKTTSSTASPGFGSRDGAPEGMDLSQEVAILRQAVKEKGDIVETEQELIKKKE